MKVILTGASGFLGRHLVAKLRSNKLLDIVPLGRSLSSEVFFVTDYCNIPDGDLVIHLAEEANRIRANQVGLEHIRATEKCIKYLIKKFNNNVIYASSAAVYKDNHELNHENSFVEGYDFYTRAKINNENLVLGSGGTVIRLTNLFGNGMAKGNIMSDIIGQLNSSEPFLYLKNSSVIRDYLYVEDAAEAIQLLINSEYRGLVNLGTGVGRSAKEVANQILECSVCKNKEIINLSPSILAPSKNVLDISRLKKVISWSPNLNFEDQIKSLLSTCIQI